MKAVIITTGNHFLPVEFPADFSFDWVRPRILCDWVEIVRPERLPEKLIMLIDEEGKLKENRINPICSWLYGADHHGDVIMGDAIIVKEDIVDGEPTCCGMTDDEVKELYTLLSGGEGK